MTLNVGFIANQQQPKIDVIDPIEQQTKQIQLKQLLTAQQDDQSQRAAISQSGGDAANYLKALAAGGNYKAYQAAQKSGLDADKTRADAALANAHAGKFLSDTETAKIAQHRDALSSVSTPQDAAAWLQSGYNDPQIGSRMQQLAPLDQALSRIPQDPAGFQQWKQQQALGATKYIEMNKPTYQTRNTGGTTDTIALPGLGGAPQVVNTIRNTQSPDSIASNATAMRGQNMTDARSRELTAATVGKPFEVTGQDGNPVLVQQDKGGNITPVQGYSPKTVADKPLNDSQSKALLFGSRMREADKVLQQLANEGTETSIVGSRAPIIGGVISAASSGNRQMLDQAKRDFMTAILRRESGAAISSGEFDTADKQYFPQIGDSDKVKAQKQRNRDLAIQGILVEVPAKQRESLQPKDSATPPKTKAGASVSNW